MPSSQQGFNLMELLVVLLVTGVLLGVVYPSGLYMLETSRQSSELNQLMAVIERARQEARITNSPVELCQGAACSSLQAGGAQANWTIKNSRKDQLVYQRSDDQAYPVQSSVERLIFKPPPQVMDEDAYLMVNSGFQQITPKLVRIAITGRAQVIRCNESEVTLLACH